MKQLLFFLAVIITLKFTLPLFGTSDMSAWVRSVSVNQAYGLVKAYSTYNMYYPPLSSTIFGTVGKLSNFQYQSSWLTDYPSRETVSKSHLPIKYTILFFLLISLILLNSIFAVPYVVLFNPALLSSSLILGYNDIFFFPTLILSYYYLRQKQSFLAGVCLATTFMIKLIPIFLLPVFVASFITLSFKPFKLSIAYRDLSLFALGVLVVISVIFSFYSLKDFLDTIIMSANHGQSLSLNALNPYWLIRQFVIPSGIAPPPLALIGKIGFLLVSVLSLLKLVSSHDRFHAVLESSLTILFSYTMLFTGAHENHLFTAFTVALMFYYHCPSRQTRWWYLGLTSIFFLNLFLFYGLGQGVTLPPYPFRLELINLSAVFAVSFYLYYLKTIWSKKIPV